jgi:putative aldouronate transport system substrate-binding protein
MTMILVLAAGPVVGCTGNSAGSSTSPSEKKEPDNFNASGFPIVKDKITMKLMGSKAPGQVPWDQMTFFQDLEKRTNIHFEFDTPPNEAYQEKLNLAFATGSLPDVLFGASLTIDKEVTYGQQKLLIPLEGLIDKYAPNLQKVLAGYPGLKQSITAPDGHIYALPRIEVRPDIPNTEAHTSYPRMWINSKWLKQLGLSMPTTTEELAAVLKAFKEKDPNGNKKADEIPLTAYKMDIRGVVMNWFGFAGTDNKLVDVKSDKVRFAPIEAEYKAYLTYMNKLNRDGLLDLESYTQTPQQRKAKGNQGQLGLFSSLAPFQLVGNNLDADYDILLPLTSEVNKERITSETSAFTRGAFAITKANKNPEATMRFVDFLYTDEGSDLGQFGLEGVNWKFNDDKSARIFIGPEGSQNKTSQELRAMATPDAGTAIPRNQSKLGADLAKIENEAKSKTANPTRYHTRAEYPKLIPFARKVYPQLYFTLDEQKEINVLQSDILTYVEQMEAKFITGSEPIDKFADFVGTLKKMNVDRYVKIHQDAYDRWKKSGK